MLSAAPATEYTASNILRRATARAARSSPRTKRRTENLAMVFILTITLLAGALSAAGQSPTALIEKAMQLKLLESTRSEVYQHFGEPPNQPRPDHTISYADDSNKITFLFSTGRCEPGDKIGWDVPESTLVSIIFSFDKRLSPKQLPFDWTNFARQKILDSRDAWNISDQLKGISFVLRTDRKIESLIFTPGENSRSLHCSNIACDSKQ